MHPIPPPLVAGLRGVFGFPVTPFRADLSLDLDALGRNVNDMAGHPFCAIVAAGGTGELYSLTVDEIEQVVRTTVEAVNGRLPGALNGRAPLASSHCLPIMSARRRRVCSPTTKPSATPAHFR